MRKLPHVTFDLPLTPFTKHRRAIGAIALGLILLPLILEGTALCAAQWRAMYGPVAVVNTPVINCLSDGLAAMAFAARASYEGTFRNIPWKPLIVIPFACAWAFCGCLLLRRS